MGIIKYSKLVRDRIPEIIENSGKKAIIETLDNSAYKKLLNSKLDEELKEYYQSDDIEELADLVEVIYAILDFKNIAIDDFERLRSRKAEERGAFRKRILLKEVVDELE